MRRNSCARRLGWHGAGSLLACLGLLLSLAGCATSVNSLSQAELSTIRIESIDVRFAPDATLWWGKAEREYAEKAGFAPSPETTSSAASTSDGEKDAAYRQKLDSPEAQAYVRDKLASEIRGRLQQALLPRFRGTRATRLEIEVHNFQIPSAAQRILLGGTPVLGAVATLRDAKTGAELAKLDRLAAGAAGQGILGVAVDQAFSDLEDRVLQTYVENVLTWLKVA